MIRYVELEFVSRLHSGAYALGLVALLLALPPAAQASRLNDTGQITCYNDTANTGNVSPSTPNPVDPGFEDQDCTRGAAAADVLGVMTKQGASSTPGRDYTKISNAGNDLPANATLGFGANDWACTRDNVTGLVWEVKVFDIAHLRHVNHTYTWYDTNGAVNGGNAGDIGSNTCNATLPSSQCNTAAYRDAINALAGPARLCGATDWRLPTGFELLGLVDFGPGAPPTIDATYFPNTFPNAHWTGVNVASSGVGGFPSRAYGVIFNGSGLQGVIKAFSGAAIRLVRGGQ